MNTLSHTEKIRDTKIHTLNELIEVTRDAANFYHDASTKIDNPKLKGLFSDMAQTKNGIVGAMSREVRSEGAKPAESGTFQGVLRNVYGDVRAKFGDKDYAYVAELEETEDRQLKAFENVLKDDKAPIQVKTVVNSYLPTVRKQHDLMRDRKWAMNS